MHIYVDFDDCLCETARAFSKLAPEMFNKHVPYDRIHFFELDRSFDRMGTIEGFVSGKREICVFDATGS